MHHFRAALLCALVLTVPSSAVLAQGRAWYGEASVGTAWSLATPLIINRPGEPEVRQQVTYQTHGFRTPLYYSVRAGRGSFTDRAPDGVELELVHQKLYLDDPRTPVEHFEVSHGYNLAFANLVRAANELVVRIGLGLVIAHPEGRIGGLRLGGSRRTFLGGGYHIAGGSIQIAAGRRYTFTRSGTTWFVPEAKLTASWARVPLGDDGGSVTMPNVALHVLAGVGGRTGGR